MTSLARFYDASKGASRALLIALASLALIASVAACGDDNGDNGDDDNQENANHADAQGGVEIATRGPASEVIAEWNSADGWTNADGDEIDELPDLLDLEGHEDFQPLRAGGNNASLTVTFFDRHGDAIEMETLSRTDESRERECSEFSVRYAAIEETTNVIAVDDVAGMGMQHPEPEMDDPPFQFAERDNGNIVGIFHCDHVHFYPENEGTVDVEFLLWHGDHSDDNTDPITVRVHEAEEE